MPEPDRAIIRGPTTEEPTMQILVAVILPLSLLLLAAACDGDKSGSNKPIPPQDSKSRPTTGPTPAQPGKADSPVVKLETTEGTIMLELNRKKAPISVENFLNYVRKGHYEGTTFHRVIPDFMIQGGGMTEDGREKPTEKPIKNEASNGLTNSRGTLAMARRPPPDSATCQFFINVVDNGYRLDYAIPATGGGYCVFGKVQDEASMKVVDAIRYTPTEGSVPKKTVKITKATIISE
jgi:cyclophilin family peptidyl-prolyl cis-trans isomerase